MIRRFVVLFAMSLLWSHTATAQVDLSGNWRAMPRNQDGSGMTGDAAGVPITPGLRGRAESWSPEEFDVAEWVCRPHAWDYSLEGPLSQLRFWPEVDQATQQIIAYHGHVNMMEQETTIWMDGRPHPPANALYTWSGFSTGVWEGNDLVVTTTHKKEAYIRRSGLVHSDQAVSRTRWRVQSWSPEDFDVTEWACRPHAWDYSLEGPLSALRIWADIDQATQKVIAYHGHLNQQEQETTIYMDGRPRPPANALHTWSGFSTGEWDGDVLVVTTTHLKEAYLRRSGLMHSDQATIRTRYRRMGDYLQATSIIYDPVMMTEPYIRSTMMWVLDPALPMSPYPCEEATETALARGHVPHFLPGKSPLPGLDKNLTDRFGTPYEPRLGGAATTYPEYIVKMKAMPKPPKVATGVGEGGN